MENEETLKVTPLEWLKIWQSVPEMVSVFSRAMFAVVEFDEQDAEKIIRLTDEMSRLQAENDALGAKNNWDLRKLPAQGDYTMRTLALMLDTVVVLQEIDDKHGNPCDLFSRLTGVGAKAVISLLAGAEIITE